LRKPCERMHLENWRTWLELAFAEVVPALGCPDDPQAATQSTVMRRRAVRIEQDPLGRHGF
jgi:hypothetical protein